MKHRSLIAIAAAGALILAACGDDDDDAVETAAVQATTPALVTDAPVETAAGPATDAPVITAAAVSEPAVTAAAVTEASEPAATEATEPAVTAAAVTEASEPAATEATEPAVTAAAVTEASEPAATEATEPAVTAAAVTEASEPAATEATEPAVTAAAVTEASEPAATEATEPAVTAAAVTEASEPAATEATEPAVTAAAVTEASEPAATEATEPAVTAAAVTEASEPAATEATEPAVTAAAVTEASEPAATEATEPAATEATEPAVTEATEPAVTEATEPAVTEATEPAVTEASVADGGTITDIVTGDAEFSTLNAALAQAGLDETLAGAGPFTVFAPSDEAFELIPPAVLESILADDTLLESILTYHVISGEALTAEELVAEGTVETINGAELTFTFDGDTLLINDREATVVGEPIQTANGIVFVIDIPLNPPAAAGGSASSSSAAPATMASSDDTTADDTTADGTTAPDGTDGGATQDAGATVFPVTPGPDWPETLTFTFTPSQEAGGIVEEAEPLAVMLEERLGLDVKPLVASDYAAVIVALQSGQAQLAGGLGPVQMVQAEDEAGADLVIQSERDGESTYVTQWFTNDPDTFCADEPISDPETGFLYCNGVTPDSVPSDGPIGQDQLSLVADQTVAFVDQGSASGYLIPSLQLSEVGVDPTTGIDATFAGSHDGAVLAVYNGDATVGVSFNDARTIVAEQFPDVGEEVVVFAWSSPIPNDGFAVAGDLPEDLKTAITDALIDIAGTEEGAAVLEELYEISDLVPADPAAFDFIREQLAVLAEITA